MAIQYSLISKVTVFCDGSLKDKIIEWGQGAGATGNTWFECHGKGRHEVMVDSFKGADRVGIVFLCNEATADRIVDGCLDPELHGLTVFKEKVEVPQIDEHKFSKPA